TRTESPSTTETAERSFSPGWGDRFSLRTRPTALITSPAGPTHYRKLLETPTRSSATGCFHFGLANVPGPYSVLGNVRGPQTCAAFWCGKRVTTQGWATCPFRGSPIGKRSI